MVNYHKKLTAKQELFAQGIAQGKDQTESFKIAYPLQAKNSKIETIYVRASELAKNIPPFCPGIDRGEIPSAVTAYLLKFFFAETSLSDNSLPRSIFIFLDWKYLCV